MPRRRAKKRPPNSRLKSKAGRKLHLEHEEELQRSRDLKRRFRAAHGLGESALKDRDYKRLGMAIRAESQIIEAHNGTLTAENISGTKPGEVKGARFVVTLPAEA